VNSAERAASLLVTVVAAFSCTPGVVGDVSSQEPGGPGADRASAPGGNATSAGGAGATAGYLPARLRLLNADEYDNTVASLLGDTSHPGKQFEPGNRQNGYLQNASQFVDSVLAGQLVDAAATLASTAVKNNLTRLVPCNPAPMGEDACAKTFISQFASAAFRRPATPDEKDALFKVYQTGRAITDFASGVENVIQAVLLAEPFLYRAEIGEGSTAKDGVITLGPYEMASALSYLVVGGPPDDTLLEAAATGALATPEQIGAQARRLFVDPRAVQQLKSFVMDWLGFSTLDKLGKDTTVYPKFTSTLRPMIQAEANAVVADWLGGSATVGGLLTSRSSFVDQELGALYGLTGGQKGSLGRVTLPSERLGILTSAAFLGVYAHGDSSAPVKRGVFIRRQVLCETLPPPPAGLKVTLPTPQPNATTRQIFDTHGSVAACAPCHNLIGSVGDAFESFDGIGAHRTTENGQPVDTAVTVTGTRESDGPYADAPSLIAKVATSTEVADCFRRQLFRFAAADRIEDLEDRYVAATSSLTTSNVYDLLLAFVQSDTFQKRSAP
jgi:hypothetical protein